MTQTPATSINDRADKGWPSFSSSIMFLRQEAGSLGAAETWSLQLWATRAPALYALLGSVVILLRWVLACFGVKRGAWSFEDFLALPEAENLVYGHDAQGHSLASSPRCSPSSKTVLVTIGLSGVLTWSAFATYQFGLEHATADAPLTVQVLLRLLPWAYGTIQAIRYRTLTPPWSLFALYMLMLVSSVSFVASAAYGYYIHYVPYTTLEVSVHALELVLVATALAIILRTPIATPRHGKETEEVCCHPFDPTSSLTHTLHSRRHPLPPKIAPLCSRGLCTRGSARSCN